MAGQRKRAIRPSVCWNWWHSDCETGHHYSVLGGWALSKAPRPPCGRNRDVLLTAHTDTRHYMLWVGSYRVLSGAHTSLFSRPCGPMDQKRCKRAFLCDAFRLKVPKLKWGLFIYLHVFVFYSFCVHNVCRLDILMCVQFHRPMFVLQHSFVGLGLFLSIWDKWYFGSRLLYFERNVSKTRIKHPLDLFKPATNLFFLFSSNINKRNHNFQGKIS